MNALCWHGKGDIRCDTVDDPTIEDDQDMIIKVTERCCNLVDLVDDIPGGSHEHITGARLPHCALRPDSRNATPRRRSWDTQTISLSQKFS